jgi:hypothetical protein
MSQEVKNIYMLHFDAHDGFECKAGVVSFIYRFGAAKDSIWWTAYNPLNKYWIKNEARGC